MTSLDEIQISSGPSDNDVSWPQVITEPVTDGSATTADSDVKNVDSIATLQYQSPPDAKPIVDNLNGSELYSDMNQVQTVDMQQSDTENNQKSDNDLDILKLDNDDVKDDRDDDPTNDNSESDDSISKPNKSKKSPFDKLKEKSTLVRTFIYTIIGIGMILFSPVAIPIAVLCLVTCQGFEDSLVNGYGFCIAVVAGPFVLIYFIGMVFYFTCFGGTSSDSSNSNSKSKSSKAKSKSKKDKSSLNVIVVNKSTDSESPGPSVAVTIDSKVGDLSDSKNDTIKGLKGSQSASVAIKSSTNEKSSRSQPNLNLSKKSNQESDTNLGLSLPSNNQHSFATRVFNKQMDNTGAVLEKTVLKAKSFVVVD